MTRTGIFLCTCDQRINKGVDVERVAQALGSEALVMSAAHVCLPDGIRSLQSDIIENDLERVVITACPARYQERRLQDACVEAGINLNQLALVDWREGCAWAHRGDKEGATAQAIDLTRMGLARVTQARPLDGVLTKIAPHALVIGGGIAGLTAARALADREITVTLVEREMELGGQLQRVPLNGNAKAFEETRFDVLHHPKIRVRLNSRVVAVHNAVGNYRIEIAGPAGSDAFELNAGSVIVATGAREYRDARLYRHDGRRIVTLNEFEQQLRPSALASRPSIVYLLCAGSRDEHISYCSNICCLGALNQAIRVKRANPMANVTILFRDLYLLGDELNEEVVREARQAGIEFVRYAVSAPPRVEDDFVVVRDGAGVTRWIGYDRMVLATALVPREDAGSVASLFNLARDEDGFFPDPHWRLRAEQQNERGIFVCGSAHRPVDIDTAVMQGLTAAARAARFIHKREVMRAASGAWVEAGLCTGCAQCVSTCPVGAISMRAGDSRAVDSNRANAGQDRPAPTGFEPTEVGLAPTRSGLELTTLDRAVVDPFLCLACGNCVVACPSKSIDLPSSSDAEIFAQIEAGLAGQGDEETQRRGDTVLVFGCQWSGFAAMELAGARRLKYSANVRVIELPCSARLDPMHVLYAFFKGADKVIMALCPPQECHFGDGNRYAEARIENLRAELAAHGINPQRLQVARMMGDDAGAWVKAIERVVAVSKPFGPSTSERPPVAG